jgi:hypothetical protein
MKNMKVFKFLPAFLILVGASNFAFSQAQNTYFYVGAAAGTTNYKGDLDDNFTLKFTKPGLVLLGGLKFNSHMSLRLTFTQGWMSASDAKAARDIPRRRRNLSFRSPLEEVSLQLVYEFFANNRKYQYRPQFTPFVFGGVSIFRFNPQAKLGNEWYDLQPLGTEGQFLPSCTDCPEPYKLVQVSIPFGAGVRYRLTKKIDLNLEMGVRKTFTDYIDDVSSEYPDMDALLASNPTAYLLSDRIDRTLYPQGAKHWNGIRGDRNQNDMYVLTMVSATYILDWVKCPKFRSR